MTTVVSPAHAWQRIAACTDRTLTIVDDDAQVITYHDLIAQAAARVPALRELGVAQGEPVLLTAHTSTDFLSVYFGLMLYGAVPVPLPPKQALKGAGQFLGRLGPLLKHHHRLVCTPEEHDEVRTDASAGRQIIPFASLAQASDLKAGYAAAQQLHADGTTDWPLPAVDDDAYVQYTSGSTAAPRGVVITYRNLLSNLDATGRSLGFRPGDVMASWLPLHHDMGLICSLAAAVFNGIDAVFTIPRRFLHDPLGFLRMTTQTGATHSFMPNFALEWLTNACNKPRADLHGIDLRELRRLLIGSEPVSADSMRRFTTAFTGLGLGPTALCSGYGLAEATCEVTASALDSGFRTEIFQDTEVVTCGRALDGYEIRIDAPPGEQAGHVKLRGPGISSRAYIDGTKLDVLDEEGFCDT
ncbi:AMP-binding protein, partial [Streptomyces syringium]|uniref:AMP-binding protein n=1 Tax=Streptomyces syringium TaxID=76729 RepID=UPI0034547AD5